jgi:hypothetical protein
MDCKLYNSNVPDQMCIHNVMKTKNAFVKINLSDYGSAVSCYKYSNFFETIGNIVSAFFHSPLLWGGVLEIH